MKRISNSGNVFTRFAVVLILVVANFSFATTLNPRQAKAAGLPAYQYTKTFDTSSGTAIGNAVKTDVLGDVYVTGTFTGIVTFDGTGGSDSRTASGNTNSFLTKYNADGSYGWTSSFDTTNGYAEGIGVATDAHNNIYITGQFTGTVVFDGTGGSDSRTDIGHWNTFITKYDASGTYEWTKSFAANLGGAYGQDVVVDKNGDIYAAGIFYGTVTFDGIGGSDTQTAANANVDTYVTKYHTDGSYAYTKTFDVTNGNTQGYTAIRMATDAQDNVYLTGEFFDTVIFDGTGGSDSRTDVSGDGNTFLTKFNANGSYGWTRSFDTTNGYSYGGEGIAIDAKGNIYITGGISGTIDFDPTGSHDSLTVVNKGGTYLTKYTANGSYVWTKGFGTTGGWNYGQGVAVDSNGDVYITGQFYGTVTFDGNGGSDTQTDVGGVGDNFVTKYTSAGTYGWTRISDTTSGTAYGFGIAADTRGNIYTTGQFDNTITFDGVGGSDTRSAPGGIGMFLTKYAAFVPAVSISSTAASRQNDTMLPSAQIITQPEMGAITQSGPQPREPEAQNSDTPGAHLKNKTNKNSQNSKAFLVLGWWWLAIFAFAIILWVTLKRRKPVEKQS